MINLKDDKKYMDHVSAILSIVQGKTVLELGSFGGWHTELMVNLGAKSIVCVEPNPNICDEDIYKHDIVEFKNCTANDYYSDTNVLDVDVVTCFGVLYHLHSPLHLLEQIINKSRPKFLIVETTYNEKIYVDDEIYDMPGNAVADKQISTPILANLIMPINDIVKCVETTNYKAIRVERKQDIFRNISKRDISIALFERQSPKLEQN